MFHSFIYSLPHSPSSLNKYHEGLNRLECLINKDIDKIHQTVNNKNKKGVNIESVFHYKNHPDGYLKNNIDQKFKYIG